MLILPDPRTNSHFRESRPARPTPAALADHIARLEGTAARRAGLSAARGGAPAMPVRWFRREPRHSIQYAGHMSTEAARDRRLTGQSKALLQVLRARCGSGARTETCKTTLAHIMGVSVRSIGRYLHELSRFGYLDLRIRHGASGLHVGLAATVTEKVLPCFRRLTWLSGWLAHCQGEPASPASGANPGKTFLSHKNHLNKDSHTDRPEMPRPAPA